MCVCGEIFNAVCTLSCYYSSICPSQRPVQLLWIFVLIRSVCLDLGCQSHFLVRSYCQNEEKLTYFYFLSAEIYKSYYQALISLLLVACFEQVVGSYTTELWPLPNCLQLGLKLSFPGSWLESSLNYCTAYIKKFNLHKIDWSSLNTVSQTVTEY